jgi:signal transduction histidine kinase/CheY-like chemotaxis protein
MQYSIFRVNGMNRLQIRLVLAFVFVLLIPTIPLTIYANNIATDQQLLLAEQEGVRENKGLADRIVDYVVRARSDALFLSRTDSTVAYAEALAEGDPAKIAQALLTMQAVLLAYAENVQLYSQIAYLDAEGQELVRVYSVSNIARLATASDLINAANEDYFVQGMISLQGETYFSSISLEQNTPVMRVTAPVYGADGQPKGVITTKVLAQPMLDLVRSEHADEVRYLFDANGNLFAGPDETQLFGDQLRSGYTIFVQYKNDAIVAQSQESGVLRNTSINPGKLQTFAQVNLPDQGFGAWTVYSLRDIEAILAPNAQTRNVIWIGAVLAMVAGIGVSVLLALQISRPLGQITKKAQEIAKGSLNQRVEIKGSREVRDLAEAFNEMLTKLKESRDDLEAKIAARTKEAVEAQSYAEQANKAKSAFLSNMSHELRTPLNVVIGYASSIMDMPQMYGGVTLPSVYEKDIRAIMENGRHLLDLINDILDLNKIEAGRLELRRRTIDLKDILLAAISTGVGLTKTKDVQIHADFPDALPLIDGDPLRVRQVALNLISNAVKFTAQGTVIVRARELDQNTIAVSVIDTGPGIPKAELATIFDRYKQGEQSEEKKFIGTGLGLDISAQLVNMHGGKLTVESAEGQGSTFTFTLPIAHQEAPTPNLPSEEHASTLMRVFDIPKTFTTMRSILLLEPDSTLRLATRSLLEQNHYLVVDLPRGINIEDTILGMLPDVVVINCDLPDADVPALCKNLFTSPEAYDIPIMVYGRSLELSKIDDNAVKLKLLTPVTSQELAERVYSLSAKSVT